MWLRGHRSGNNQFLGFCPDSERRLEVLVLIAQYDAAMMEQALTVLRAHAKGLI